MEMERDWRKRRLIEKYLRYFWRDCGNFKQESEISFYNASVISGVKSCCPLSLFLFFFFFTLVTLRVTFQHFKKNVQRDFLFSFSIHSRLSTPSLEETEIPLSFRSYVVLRRHSTFLRFTISCTTRKLTEN